MFVFIVIQCLQTIYKNAYDHTHFKIQRKMKYLFIALLMLSIVISSGCSNIVECSSESDGVEYVNQLKENIKDVSNILIKTVFFNWLFNSLVY